MVNAITESLTTVGMLGLVLALITVANIMFGTTYNVFVLKKPFELKKFGLGFVKAVIIYIGVGLLTVGVAAIPVVVEECGLSSVIDIKSVEIFSVAAIVAMLFTTIIKQGLGAVKNLGYLLGIGTETAIQKAYIATNEQENNN